jgi:hypothetical protein
MPDALEDILAEAENPAYVRTQTAKVLFRQDLVTRHAELDAELAAAIARDRTTNEPDQAPVIAHQIAELQDEMTAALREFTFKNIGKKAWADLLAQHPPTKEQLAVEAEEAKEQGRKPRFFDHNLASHSPKMDEDAVRRLEAALTDSQFTLLWRACFDANLGGADVPKSLAAGQILRVNGQYANTAVLAASPAASS